MEAANVILAPMYQLGSDSASFITKCSKPDSREFIKMAKATLAGFVIMGFIGFFVKLIHIPINNIIIGA